jgi:hypothetical protein
METKLCRLDEKAQNTNPKQVKLHDTKPSKALSPVESSQNEKKIHKSLKNIKLGVKLITQNEVE